MRGPGGRAYGRHTMNARERMLQGLPLSERVVPAAGVATTVLEGGEGPPLLLLHGSIECGGAELEPVAALDREPRAGDRGLGVARDVAAGPERGP